ncbi:hypothetical protein Chor_002178 [Crotalus horridus]
MIGLLIFCVGIYAEVERQKHRTLEGLFLAPAVILILLGLTIFAVSFIGMVGSLRDNRMLLKTAPGEVINTLCGYRTLNQERLELVNTIYVRGCIHAVSFWFKDNFEATLAIVCSLLLPQVFGLVMAWLHWQKLNEIHSQMDTVDFRQLDWSNFNFATLDLTGAGWCWCLPREGGYIPVCDKDDGNEVETAISHGQV